MTPWRRGGRRGRTSCGGASRHPLGHDAGLASAARAAAPAHAAEPAPLARPRPAHARIAGGLGRGAAARGADSDRLLRSVGSRRPAPRRRPTPSRPRHRLRVRVRVRVAGPGVSDGPDGRARQQPPPAPIARFGQVALHSESTCVESAARGRCGVCLRRVSSHVPAACRQPPGPGPGASGPDSASRRGRGIPRTQVLNHQGLRVTPARPGRGLPVMGLAKPADGPVRPGPTF